MFRLVGRGYRDVRFYKIMYYEFFRVFRVFRGDIYSRFVTTTFIA